jgi:glycosyltransferase involved in cell wall biosynthesis
MTVQNIPITIVATCNDRAILDNNLLRSSCLRDSRTDQVIIQEGYASASLAYNDAIDKARTDIIVFAHQDVYFPEGWLADLDRAVSRLAEIDPNWGVLGGFGVTRDGREVGYLHSEGLGVLGAPFDAPIPIGTLDEFLLVLRKSSGLRFDPTLPYFHFYGTEICLAARKEGLRCYAISAFCVHNTRPLAGLPREFYDCYAHVKRAWKEYLPITTPCIRVTKWNGDMYRRRLRAWHRSLVKKSPPSRRLNDPRSVQVSRKDEAKSAIRA